VQGTRHHLFVLGPLLFPSSAAEPEKAEATEAGRLDALEGILTGEASLVGGTVAAKPTPTTFLNTPLLFYEWDTQSRDGAAALWTLASVRREGDCLRTRWLSLGAARKPKDKGILRRHVVWSHWLFAYERGRDGDSRRFSLLGPFLRYERDAAGRRLRLLHFIRIPLGGP
jgi:hypothetical protein